MKPDNVNGNLLNPQSWNLYSYCGNNPVNRNDPTGHFYMIGAKTRGTYSWDVPAGSSSDPCVPDYFSASFSRILSIFNTSTLTCNQQTAFTGALWLNYSTPLGSEILSRLVTAGLPIDVVAKETGLGETTPHFSGGKITGFTLSLNFGRAFKPDFSVPYPTKIGQRDFSAFKGKAFQGKGGQLWRLASIMGHEFAHMDFDLANQGVAIEYEELTNLARSVGSKFGAEYPGEAGRLRYMNENLIEQPAWEMQEALDRDLQILYETLH